MPTTITSAGITFNDATTLTSANITLADGAVTNQKLADGAVTAAKLGTNEQKQIAKAWVNFNGTTSPGTIRSSYNVSSITKNGTGSFTVNMTNSLSDSNYSVVTGLRSSGTTPSTYVNIVDVSSQANNSFVLSTVGFGWNVGADTPFVFAAVFGN